MTMRIYVREAHNSRGKDWPVDAVLGEIHPAAGVEAAVIDKAIANGFVYMKDVEAEEAAAKAKPKPAAAPASKKEKPGRKKSQGRKKKSAATG